MRVWIVVGVGWEHKELHGVFASEQSANAALEKLTVRETNYNPHEPVDDNGDILAIEVFEVQP